ncbi:hypothetical protein [Nannocystis punicea]|uniref:Uncharacterized protein n=1 Tax=Nannocystis punicea TaxID=2995304 RepID=A0ABY7H6N3_9BACT|nr:hypothetical protein [Nannocystis poenicansa]WAS94760.1 hypothetical protein O0S08_01255 [Nannocystis poenicansa]
MPTVDYLNISVHGYACEILVNDAPIARTPLGDPYTATPPISEWLITGDNELAVRIDAVAPPTACRDPLSPRRLIVQRCVGELGEVVPAGEDQVLDEIDFTPHPDDAPLVLPLRLSDPFRLPSGPTWAWQSAPRLQLDAATIAELLMFLDVVHADLAVGDMSSLLSRQQIKFAEVAPLCDTTPEAAQAELRDQFTALAADGAWSVEPLRPDDLELRLCCHGRVVEPRTRDGRPALRGRAAEGSEWSLPIFIARIDGMFEIVR